MTDDQSPEAVSPSIGRFVEVAAGLDDAAGPKTRVHLLEAGRRDAPALVLIHGASGNLRDFAFSFIDRIKDRFRIVAIDRPGFGHSERPDGLRPWRPEVQARIMRRAARSVGVERPILLGHSLGAASALAWAVADPEQVAGVVSVSGVSHAWPGPAGALYDIAATPVLGALVAMAASRLVSESYAARELGRIFAPQSPPDGYLNYVGVGLALRPKTFRANGQDVARLKPILAEQQKRYPELPMPIEAIHGTADDIVPLAVHAEPLSNRAPRGRLTRLEGVGHMPHHTHPGSVVEALDRLSAEARVA